MALVSSTSTPHPQPLSPKRGEGSGDLTGREARTCLFLTLLFLIPLQLLAVCSDEWLFKPPKPIGDGIDYEAIGYCVAQGDGWSTHYSDPKWQSPYLEEDLHSYGGILARKGPLVPDTNRPPLLPGWIGLLYTFIPRGPWAFAAIRISLALALAFGSALFALWGMLLLKSSSNLRLQQMAPWVPYGIIAILFTERNLRNYFTDFLTEPFAYLGTPVFMLLLWWGTKEANRLAIVGAAAAFAFLILCRSAFVLWIPGLVIFLPFVARASRSKQQCLLGREVRTTLLFFFTLLLLVSPWWFRNSLVLNEWMPLGTKGATTLLGGYCDEALTGNGEWVLGPERSLRLANPEPSETVPAKDWIDHEKKIASLAKEEVLHWIRNHWVQLPELGVKRVVTEWNPYNGKSLVFKILAILGCIALFLLDRIALCWIALPLLLNTLLAAGTYSLGGRYLVPSYGCFYLLVFVGVMAVGDGLLRLPSRSDAQ